MIEKKARKESPTITTRCSVRSTVLIKFGSISNGVLSWLNWENFILMHDFQNLKFLIIWKVESQNKISQKNFNISLLPRYYIKVRITISHFLHLMCHTTSHFLHLMVPPLANNSQEQTSSSSCAEMMPHCNWTSSSWDIICSFTYVLCVYPHLTLLLF